MREIKFRAWDKKENKMLRLDEFSSGNYTNNGHTPALMTWHGDVYENGELKDLILMQYTGLKDKNNIEIYEGDILHIGSNEYEVSFYRDGFIITHIVGKGTMSLHQYNTALEIVGNIYENN